MQSTPFDSKSDNYPSYKVLLLGNSSVGKTCILLRYSEDKFTEEYDVTIGLNYRTKDLELKNKTKIKMQIWDTSGEEKFKAIAKNFYREAHGVLLVYDICDRNSFKEVKNWISQIFENSGNEDIVIVLAGNKIDRVNDRLITKEEGEAVAREYDIPFFECSAKNNDNINEVFEVIANRVFDKLKKNRKNSGKGINLGEENKKKGGCC